MRLYLVGPGGPENAFNFRTLATLSMTGSEEGRTKLILKL
jgi:hypothetical protein